MKNEILEDEIKEEIDIEDFYDDEDADSPMVEPVTLIYRIFVIIQFLNHN